jgi:CheY-like chemotaxis protein
LPCSQRLTESRSTLLLPETARSATASASCDLPAWVRACSIAGAVDRGELVLAAIDRAGSVDVVVMDVRMPGMDGLEATRWVKHTYPDVAVVLHTAFGGCLGGQGRCLRRGSQGWSGHRPCGRDPRGGASGPPRPRRHGREAALMAPRPGSESRADLTASSFSRRPARPAPPRQSGLVQKQHSGTRQPSIQMPESPEFPT